LGLIAGLSGSIFGTISSNRWSRLVIGSLLLVFALVMFDVIPVRLPSRMAAWAGSLGGGSYPAVFLLGATSGIVAAPCGAPAFAVVLTWVAATHSATLGFVYLFVFSLGMTAVLMIVGVFSGVLAILPKPGAWMIWIKKVAGVVLLLMAEYYFVKAGQVWLNRSWRCCCSRRPGCTVKKQLAYPSAKRLPRSRCKTSTATRS